MRCASLEVKPITPEVRAEIDGPDLDADAPANRLLGCRPRAGTTKERSHG
jgi:hypothetical protein